MRIAIGIAAVLLVAAGVPAAKLPPPMRLNLVQASCNALPPAVAGPCSTFRFASGTVVMKPIKQPQPSCPKTGQPTEAPGGTLQLRGVTKDGAAFNGSLPAEAWLKTTFGADPNGNCGFQNLQVPNFQSLLGTLTCRNGTCKGVVYPVECLPTQCADTPVSSEFGSVEVGAQKFGPFVVFDDAGNPLATPGTALTPGREP